MATSIRDLFVSVTTKVDSGGLTALDKKLDGVKDRFSKVAGFLAGGFIAKGIADFVGSTLNAADALAKTSTKLGISTDELERFGFAAQLSGIGAESMNGALNKLNKSIGDNVKGFVELGISLKESDGSARNTGDVFAEVADKFTNLKTQGERTRLAMELFGRSGAELAPLLAGGSKGLAEMSRRFDELGGSTPEEFQKQSEAINDTLTEIGMTSKRMKQLLIASFAPGLLSAAKGLVNVTSKIVQFEKRTAALTRAVKLAISTFAAMKLATLAGRALKAAKAFTTLKNAVAFGKSLILQGGLVLAALAVEELITFAAGGKSVLGDFMTALVGPAKAQEFADQLLSVWTQVKEIFAQALPAVAAMLADGLPAAINGFIKLADVISRTVALLVNLVKLVVRVPEMIGNLAISGDQQTDVDVRKQKERDQIFDSLGSVFDTDNFGGLKGTKAIEFNTAMPALPPASIMNPPTQLSPADKSWKAVPQGGAKTVQQTNQTTINVQSTDPKAAGEEVAKRLPDANKRTLRDANNALKNRDWQAV